MHACTHADKPGAVLLTLRAGGALSAVASWPEVVGATAPLLADKGEVLGLVNVSSAGGWVLRVVGVGRRRGCMHLALTRGFVAWPEASIASLLCGMHA